MKTNVNNRQTLTLSSSMLTILGIEGKVRGAIVTIDPGMRSGLLNQKFESVCGIKYDDSRTTVSRKIKRTRCRSKIFENYISDTYDFADYQLTFDFDLAGKSLISIFIWTDSKTDPPTAAQAVRLKN